MKIQKVSSSIAAKLMAVLMFVCSSASATIPNPDPSAYGDDIGASLFQPGDFMVSIKAADPLAPAYGTAFGFYRPGLPFDTANYGILFDSSNEISSTVGIDFLGGSVIDIGAGNIVKSTFTPGKDPIGFFFYIAPPTGSAFALYSDPTANSALGLGNVFAAFPSLSAPGQFLLTFAVPVPGGDSQIISLEIAGPLAAVPEPGHLALLLSGLMTVAFASRYRARRLS